MRSSRSRAGCGNATGRVGHSRHQVLAMGWSPARRGRGLRPAEELLRQHGVLGVRGQGERGRRQGSSRRRRLRQRARPLLGGLLRFCHDQVRQPAVALGGRAALQGLVWAVQIADGAADGTSIVGLFIGCRLQGSWVRPALIRSRGRSVQTRFALVATTARAEQIRAHRTSIMIRQFPGDCCVPALMVQCAVIPHNSRSRTPFDIFWVRRAGESGYSNTVHVLRGC